MSSVLAMMYLVMFGSLAAAMAVVAQSNLRTADSSVKVSRAMSAAETGLVFGARRLIEQSQRFVVTDGQISYDFGRELWIGTANPAEVTVLGPPTDEAGDPEYIETVAPDGIMDALLYVFENIDQHWIEVVAADAALPNADTDNAFLEVKPIALSLDDNAPYFRLRYDFLSSADTSIPTIRVTSVGIDGDIERAVSIDFELTKKIEYAIISPNRIMIGKNVRVEGPLGSRYGSFPDGSANPDELDLPNGDPVVLRSDFYDLDPDLDALLDTFFQMVVDYDVDGDNRLRPGHPEEGVFVTLEPDLVDIDGDEYVDDFDLFLFWYDADGDGRVVYDEDLALAAGFTGLSAEYGDGPDDDNQLMALIDEARPDRDDNGEGGEWNDVLFGYRDGVVDVNDHYAKLDGRLMLSVARADWEFYHGDSYQVEVQGPIKTGVDQSPIRFEVTNDEMLELTTNMFNTSQTWFEDQVPPAPVANPSDLPEDPAALAVADVSGAGTYYPPGSPPPGIDAYETVPFGSPGAYDYYRRPVYENMVFENVRIPRGNNGLFINCTFVGVTWIGTVSHEDDEGHWNYTGAYLWEDANLDGLRQDAEMTLGKFSEPDDPYSPMTSSLPDGTRTDNTRLFSNNIRFESCTFLGSVGGNRIGSGADTDYTYTHWRNKVQFTGNTRFYIDPEDEDLAEQPDAATLIAILEAIPEEDLEELRKSSIMLPGWSVDAGSFDAFAPKIKLSGVIVAGVLDIRGRAEVDGTLLMTYRPVRNEGPLRVMGSINVDKFNTTVGYFSALEGDSEGNAPEPGEYGEIVLRYNPDGILPDGIPWPITVLSIEDSYLEGGQ